MLRVFLLTALAMLAFAGNSILCRMALKGGHIDPLSFTVLRLFSGACLLALLAWFGTAPRARPKGSWVGAAALVSYAVSFSLAYVGMDAGPGSLVLFAAVQLSMLGFGLSKDERLGAAAVTGLGLSLVGLAFLLLPGSSAPPVGNSLLMAIAGSSWTVYTLFGRKSDSPLAATAGNFMLATPLAVAVALPFLATLQWDTPGLVYAVLSGAVTSALGYVIWYRVLPDLTVTRAGIVQLSVPVIAVLAGVWLLQEPLSLRIVLSSLGVLAGMAIVLLARTR